MDKVRDVVVRGALILALLLPVYFLIAAFGSKFHLLDWRLGFVQMTIRWGTPVLLSVAGLAVVALSLALFTPPRRGVLSALVALAIPALAIGYGVYVRSHAGDIAPIHDITTDFVDPPGFSADVVAARAAVHGANSLDLLSKRTRDGRAFTDVQREAYPDIAYIITGIDQQRAFEAALALAREQGWKIGRADPQAGIVEATSETFWYGFVDDIVVRVRAEGSGARIDMRSVSRVGGSDIGMNARRMRPYLATLAARLRAAEGAA